MKRGFAALVLVLSVIPGATALASSAFIVLQRLGRPTIVMTEVSSDEAYDPRYLSALDGYDMNDVRLDVKSHADAQHVVLDDNTRTTAIIVRADFGYHARRQGQENWLWARKTTIKGARWGLHAFKESVNLYPGSQRNQHAHGLFLEIIPEIDPFRLHRGDLLPIRVLLNGHPLKGVRVNEDFLDTLCERSSPTTAQGETAVRLHADRMNVLQLTYEEPVKNDPDADFMRFNTALTFDLGTVPDRRR